MQAPPLISVVMGVYNGATALDSTVKSVLEQKDVDFEFIIVDDGSTDGTPALLRQCASLDSRIRVVTQNNQGLTRALVHGCAQARGRFIARQDCGDRSRAGRLKREADVLAHHPDVALVSCATRFAGPAGEFLFDAVIDEETAAHGLKMTTLKDTHGPSHHGSTMFRRELYETVGGYRKEFYFAQDLDLWTRLVDHGRHVALADILYEANLALNSISSLHRKRQIENTHIILECSRLRRAGRSDAAVLAQAPAIRPNGQRTGRADAAAALYFVGACLRAQADPRAKEYFRRALRAYPLHLKSAVRLLLG